MRAATGRWTCLGAVAAALFVVTCACVPAQAAPPRPRPVRKDLKVEDLGSPLRLRGLPRPYVAKNQKTGELHFLAAMTGGDMPFQVFDVNLNTGASRLATAAADVHGIHWTPPFPHSNGRFYWEHRQGGRPGGLVEYDPASGRLRHCGDIPGPAHAVPAWMFEGKDGKIYAGRLHLSLCRYDPATGVMEGVGPLGRHDKDYGYIYSIAVKEPYTYMGTCMYGGEYYLIVYNWETGKHVHHFIPTAEEKKPLSMHDVYTDAEGNVYYGGNFVVNGERKHLMYRMEGDQPVLLTERVTGLRCMRSVHGCPDYWSPEQAKERFGLELDLSEAVPTAWNDGGMKVRWRRGVAEWRTAEARGAAVHPVSIGSLAATPEGTLFGSGTTYYPFFTFNPKTGESGYLGPTAGSIYQIHVVGDRAYFCGYSALFNVYDRTRPWTYGTGAAAEAEGAKPNPLSVPAGAQWNSHMAIGADGRAYVGGRHGRHHTGGDFFRYDPQTGKIDSFREQFKECLVYDVIAINQGRLILVSTRPMKAEEPNARLFIYDTEKHALRHTEPLPGSRDLGNFLDGGADCVVCMMPATPKTAEGADEPGVRIYRLNVLTGKMLYDRQERGERFFGGTRSTERCIFLGPDNCGWFFLQREGANHLARVYPADGTVETVLAMKQRGRLVFLGNDLYLYHGETGTVGTSLLRIANVFD